MDTTGAKPNLDYDRITAWDDPLGMAIEFKWHKGDTVIHQVTIHAQDLAKLDHPLCPACLMYRGQMVEMTDTRQVNGKEYERCPECKGVYPGVEGRCTCGQVPHRASCPMGFPMYFLLE